MFKLYNTLTKKKETFTPLVKGKVAIYTCGPTVYDFAHVGNLRTYIFEDILKRVLEYNGYKVKHVMNITDVGHLTSDADTGEDKIEKRAKRERKTAWEIANFYTKVFKKDIKKLNIKEPNIWIKATETIKDQINLIKILEEKGFTYRIEDGVYFDSLELKTYGRFWGEKERKIKPGARVKIAPGKRNPTDFALWKFTPKGVKRQMEWDSPWGRGFPGWHTECVVMGIKNLGIPFDIHCGGIDHILIHHTNEIAQAEAAYGKILAHYWLHGEFLLLKEKRMGKSERNIIILEDLIKKGVNPLVYRYLCLTAHYRSPLIFSWRGLKGAQIGLNNLYQIVRELKSEIGKRKIPKSKEMKIFQEEFLNLINNDLDIPKALALIWKVVKNKDISKEEKYELLLNSDKVFGLRLDEIRGIKIPLKIKRLVEKREKYREEKDWERADEIRKKIEKLGYRIEDTKEGPKVKKIEN
ncbi:cysteine--tRNA ligase [bacterium (Candidatus Gribaldobacteria) CG_4_10_14_0_2_um_filter_36_18]|uniref:Cysteine--tRNA ligase n=1 Tax=bacterium (Candidatus Gribaldobacteria) CG_4_10_14_0_2_um_filter_36_18 TaxID=2014264 RepID=A0A2M7VKE4_9BACT|nr:MAG: cysteine--tRNA ligase [bacterium (Candidatus Gribaldobacteria) CG_4_10_14_0_2_um_filter_36_18]